MAVKGLHRRATSVAHQTWYAIRAERGHAGWIAIWTMIATAGTLAFPVLLVEHPVLLMMAAPRTLAVAVAADRLDLAEFVALGTIRLSIADPSYFFVGRRLAHNPLAASAAKPRRFRRFRTIRWMMRSPVVASAVLFLRPNGRHLAAAGALGIPFIPAVAAALAGTVAYLTVVHIGIHTWF